MAAADNIERFLNQVQQQFPGRAFQVNAATTIYLGQAVFQDAVTFGATHTAAAGANQFIGIAVNYYANAGAITALAIPPLTVEVGQIEKVLAITGLTADDVGKPVYATDSNTFTMTAAGASLIGYVWAFISGTDAYVSIASHS